MDLNEGINMLFSSGGTSPVARRSAIRDFADPGSVKAQIEASLLATERRAAQLLEKLAVVEAYGEDVWPDGTVIVFIKQFAVGGTEYSYVAIKTPIGWYISGRDASRGRTWDELIALFTERGPAPEVFVATELTPIGDTLPE